MDLEKVIPVFIIFVFLFILSVGFIAGFALGTYNQETVMLNEIKIRDFNLSGRMCIYGVNHNEIGIYNNATWEKLINEKKLICNTTYPNPDL